MPENPKVNRYLKNKVFDHIDHALGRPVEPLAPTYRNYFATNGSEAVQFVASPYWDEGAGPPGMRYFHVNNAGRAALKDHLKEIGEEHAAYVVSHAGGSRIIAAKSRGKARYRAYLYASDFDGTLTFIDFVNQSTVRRYNPAVHTAAEQAA